MSPRPASPHRARALEMLRPQSEGGEGKTAAQVAEELGVSLGTVKGWARSLGLRGHGQRGPDRAPRGPHQAPRGEALPVIDLLLQGVPVSVIAASLDRTIEAICQVRDRWLSDDL